MSTLKLPGRCGNSEAVPLFFEELSDLIPFKHRQPLRAPFVPYAQPVRGFPDRSDPFASNAGLSDGVPNTMGIFGSYYDEQGP